VHGMPGSGLRSANSSWRDAPDGLLTPSKVRWDDSSVRMNDPMVRVEDPNVRMNHSGVRWNGLWNATGRFMGVHK
jgi:hypothetical protein